MIPLLKPVSIQIALVSTRIAEFYELIDKIYISDVTNKRVVCNYRIRHAGTYYGLIAKIVIPKSMIDR